MKVQVPKMTVRVVVQKFWVTATEEIPNEKIESVSIDPEYLIMVREDDPLSIDRVPIFTEKGMLLTGDSDVSTMLFKDPYGDGYVLEVHLYPDGDALRKITIIMWL